MIPSSEHRRPVAGSARTSAASRPSTRRRRDRERRLVETSDQAVIASISESSLVTVRWPRSARLRDDGASASSIAWARSAISALLDDARRALQRVREAQQARARARRAARPSRARARPAPSCSSSSRASTRKYLYGSCAIASRASAAATSRNSSFDSAGSCDAVCSVWPELASVSLRRLRDVGDRDVDLLDRGRLLLGRQLDLARRLGRGRRRARRSA